MHTTAAPQRRSHKPARFLTAASLLAALALPFTNPAPASAAAPYPEIPVEVSYNSGEWNVVFKGTARADDTYSTYFHYEGDLYCSNPVGRFPAPRAELLFGGVSKDWDNHTVSCDTWQNHVKGTGKRGNYEKVEFKVGANSGLLGIWEYGPAKQYNLHP